MTIENPYEGLIQPPGGLKDPDDAFPEQTKEEELGAAYAKTFPPDDPDAQTVLKHLRHECYYERSWYNEARPPTDVTYCEGRRSIYIGINKWIKLGRGEE